MRKVTLSMKSQEKYEIIKRLSEGHITKTTASIKIGCTKRHIQRRIVKDFLIRNEKIPMTNLSHRDLNKIYL